jgi:hypothetical protein
MGLGSVRATSATEASDPDRLNSQLVAPKCRFRDGLARSIENTNSCRASHLARRGGALLQCISIKHDLPMVIQGGINDRLL